MTTSSRSVAVVFPASLPRLCGEELETREELIRQQGYAVTVLRPELESTHQTAAGPDLERATLLSFALTKRTFAVLWAARGGYGTTALIPFLQTMLPPVLPPKMLIGFSDVSFIGTWLSFSYPTVTYVHGRHFYARDLVNDSDDQQQERQLHADLVSGKCPAPQTIHAEGAEWLNGISSTLVGLCVPINLSLAAALTALPDMVWPTNTILFIEDINEPLFRVLRHLDVLRNSGAFSSIRALVLGHFTHCTGTNNQEISRNELLQIVSQHTSLPTISLPIFGHENACFPLVCLSRTVISKNKDERWDVTLSFERAVHEALLPPPSKKCDPAGRLHFTGIGGTGMASVAGVFQQAGHHITGSDGPIYPPMSEVIAGMGVTPTVGYQAETIDHVKPSAIVLSNVITKRNAQLQGNPELNRILVGRAPMYSFPSALRNLFLREADNIVISGTHGKTTTTSLVVQLLRSIGYDPSFIVGGAPRNFDTGYHLGSRKLFVLEGDEYDTAYFDKGPKFLHYEPRVALINNIEFDHADIYDDVESIEAEFFRLTQRVVSLNGVLVVNGCDDRVMRVTEQARCARLVFGSPRNSGDPSWTLQSWEPQSNGMRLTVETPWGQIIELEARLFGEVNASNLVAGLAVVHAYRSVLTARDLSKNPAECLRTPMADLDGLLAGVGSFLGVRRRFEFLGENGGIAVFDDFAHHPTAIAKTLEAFRGYIKATSRTGKLIACFEPRNATMRRSVMQTELARSLQQADRILLGPVPQDARLRPEERLDGGVVASLCGETASAYATLDELLRHLLDLVAPGDTVVFMGASGSFAGVPEKLLATLKNLA